MFTYICYFNKILYFHPKAVRANINSPSFNLHKLKWRHPCVDLLSYFLFTILVISAFLKCAKLKLLTTNISCKNRSKENRMRSEARTSDNTSKYPKYLMKKDMSIVRNYWNDKIIHSLVPASTHHIMDICLLEGKWSQYFEQIWS